MAASGYTPILIYGSSTASNVPLAANLTTSASGVELAINAADGKLYYKDSGGAVQVLATKAGAFGTVTSVAATVPSFLSISGSPITSSGTLAIGLSGTALPTTSGGTGLTSFTANGVVYASSTSALATGSALTFDGTNLTATNGNILVTGTGVSSFPASYAGMVLLATNTNIGAGWTTNVSNPATLFGGYYDAISVGLIAGYGGTRNGIQVGGTSSSLGNAVTFMLAGSEQMRLTSTGLGIGTSSPAQKLHISQSSSASPIFTQMTAGANSSYWGWNSVDSIWTFQANTGIDFYTGSSYVKRMTLDSSGNLGLGVTANASAIFDAQSTTKGVRMPNMTTTQKNAIASPAAGLIVFDTTLAKLCVYSGAAWQTITSI